MDEFNPQEAMAALDPQLGKPGTSAVFPKFQYSIFAGENKSEQYVVRDNDFNDFKTAVKAVKANIELSKKVAQSFQTPQVYSDNLNAICPIHNVGMEQKNGQFGPYWSHRIEGAGYCNGKKITPFKTN
jgi:hypothetical protein